MYKKSTLCWHCKNATGLCSWSKRFIPVKGWKAIKTTINRENGGGYAYTYGSYIVLECPQYVSDGKKIKWS